MVTMAKTFFKVFVFIIFVAGVFCSTPVSFSAINCHQFPAPKNGQIQCIQDSGSTDVTCTTTCNAGYDVEFLSASKYVCHKDGTWEAVPNSVGLPWPNCIIYGRGDPVP